MPWWLAASKASRVKFGLTLCDPEDVRVVEKHICHSRRSAELRGRRLKRQHPDHVVRLVSLLPGDTSPPEEIPLVPLGASGHRTKRTR
jgi:hypothetical protein